MPTLRECYLNAKDAFVKISSQPENTVIEQARNFLFDCAKDKSWETAEYFIDELRNIEFPLEKLNLFGENDETVHWILATDPNPQFDHCSGFIARLAGFCEKIPNLPDKSDAYYYETHHEEYANLLAGQIADELILS